MPVQCHLTLVIGPERKSGFLDEEFNRVTETLDKEYKRLSYALYHKLHAPFIKLTTL